MAPKLPLDLNIFPDGPLRSTAPALAPIMAAVVAAPKAVEATQPSLPEPVQQLRPAPKAAKPAPVELLKRTVYLTREQDLAIEEAVYEGRKTGNRVSFADVHRDILNEWAAARAGQRKAGGQ
jgi:hypothetical protein